MASTLLIGTLTIKKARSFIVQLKQVAKTTDTLFIYIHSHGGSLRAYAEIAEAMLSLSNEGKTIIGQAVHVGSTAMLIFLNCNERLVTPATSGYIHIPVPNTQVQTEIYKKKVDNIIAFIARRTGLSAEQIRSLDTISLGATELLLYKIATKKVPSFTMEMAEP
jgi:ATP-dependent protease ClpP protease subunit